jgi:hypothetical protein
MANLDKSTVKDLLLKLADMNNRIHNYDVGGASNVLDSTASKMLLIDQKIADQMYKLYDSISDRLYPIDNRPKLVPEFEKGIISLIHFVCNYYLMQIDSSFERLTRISTLVVSKASRGDSSVYYDAKDVLQLMYNYDHSLANEYSRELDYFNSYRDYSRLSRKTQEICGNIFKNMTDKVLKSF